MARVPRLLQKNSLTFTRKNTTGAYDNSGNWVEGTAKAPVGVKGSLQPFREGDTRVDLPQGVSARDVRIFYTVHKLQTANDFTNAEADVTVIDGINFTVYNQEDWNVAAVTLAHYKTFLIRQDKL